MLIDVRKDEFSGVAKKVGDIFEGRTGPPAAWHFSGGPIGPVSRWAATSKAEVCLTTYHVNRARVGRGKQGTRTKSQRGGQERKECKKGPLATEGGLYLDIFCAGPPSS